MLGQLSYRLKALPFLDPELCLFLKPGICVREVEIFCREFNSGEDQLRLIYSSLTFLSCLCPENFTVQQWFPKPVSAFPLDLTNRVLYLILFFFCKI